MGGRRAGSADLRGVNSLGVSVLLKHYVTGFQDGCINPRPNWKIIRETPTTANIDSDQGLGTMGIAINKSRCWYGDRGECQTPWDGNVPCNESAGS
ncbi:MAG: Ldh family oxidoreductase [SAR202 cluster bacterium]|nr:Ldh family oxidoreductase [SAR202 cluster bacterium]